MDWRISRKKSVDADSFSVQRLAWCGVVGRGWETHLALVSHSNVREDDHANYILGLVFSLFFKKIYKVSVNNLRLPNGKEVDSIGRNVVNDWEIPQIVLPWKG